MSASEPTTLELKPKQLEFLDRMVNKYNLPDRSKALRILITYAMEESDEESKIFETIRCADC